jgi:hypothetical protein
MKQLNWQLRLGGALIVLSTVLYLVHIAIFKDPHQMFFYLVEDIAFIPVQVLLVTLILHQLLTLREKRAMLLKLNMVIGTFFSEVGREFLKRVAALDANSGALASQLKVTGDWTEREFRQVSRRMKGYESKVSVRPEDLSGLRAFMLAKQNILLGLLQNPNLLEHDAFSELLWSVFHVAEELAHRTDFAASSEADRVHLTGDIRRAYGALIRQWLDYMNHLRTNYPSLFSLAMRTNPFDPSARPDVAE